MLIRKASEKKLKRSPADAEEPKTKKSKADPGPQIKKENGTKKTVTKSSKTQASKKVKKEKAAKLPEEKPLSQRQILKQEQEKKEAELVWKWWEDPKNGDDSIKWTTLEHSGPYFAPEYVPLPDRAHFKYDGKVFKLNPLAEEAAFFYSHFIEHDYTKHEMFRKNFFADFTKLLNKDEAKTIKTLEKCDFTVMNAYLQEQREVKKAMTKEEKEVIKAKNKEIEDSYGYCIVDGHKQKIGNFKIEPPGLFRGRGEHPKMGKLKQRTVPEDVIINCSK